MVVELRRQVATGPSLITLLNSPHKTTSAMKRVSSRLSTATIDAKQTITAVELTDEAATATIAAVQMTTLSSESTVDARVAETDQGVADAEVATQATEKANNSKWQPSRSRSGKRHSSATWRKLSGRLRRPSATTARCW